MPHTIFYSCFPTETGTSKHRHYLIFSDQWRSGGRRCSFTEKSIITSEYHQGFFYRHQPHYVLDYSQG